MCGIGVYISIKATKKLFEKNEWPFQYHNSDDNGQLREQLLQHPQNAAMFVKEDLFRSLQRRGPNSFNCIEYTLQEEEDIVNICSAVLHLRGQSLFSQPVNVFADDGKHDCGSFCYNGEIFDLRSKDIFFQSVLKHVDSIVTHENTKCPTRHLLMEFLKCIKKSPSSMFHFETNWLDQMGHSNELSDTEWLSKCINEIANFCFCYQFNISSEKQEAASSYIAFDILLKCTLEQIKGPHAFIHYCPFRRRLFLMRDVLGRRSLCFNYNEMGDICIANVALGEEAVELPCNGAILLKLDCTANDGYLSFDFIPRMVLNDPFSAFIVKNTNDHDAEVTTVEKEEAKEDQNSIHSINLPLENYQRLFNASLYEAVRKRVSGHSQISVLFSGGLDSTVLAAITAKVLLEEEEAEEEAERKKNNPHQPEHIPSGNRKWGRVQLINVTFDAKKGPDRNTCLLSYKDLIQNFPKNTFDLILIDCFFDQIEQEKVLYLLGPNNTHMDFNISTCLWYSACGKGYLINPDTMANGLLDNLLDQAYVPEFKGPGGDKRKGLRMDMLIQTFPTLKDCFHNKLHYFQSIQINSNDGSQKRENGEFKSSSEKKFEGDAIKKQTKNTKGAKNNKDAFNKNNQNTPSIDPKLYKSKCPYVQAPSPILIMGHGADEILGGYGRHMSTFEKFGLERLKSELWLDCNRLWTRNLGRDDRVLSDWGREARHPFLDEDFIETVTHQLPPLVDKLFLRNFAATELGLAASAARFEKRAIQFGTRLAKQSNKEKFQTNRQGRARGTEKFQN